MANNPGFGRLLWPIFFAALMGLVRSYPASGADSAPAPANYTSASLALRDEPAPAPALDNNNSATTSTDPLAQWTIVNSGETSEFFTVRWINHQFIALGTNAIMTSPDGITWQNTAGNLTSKFLDIAGNGNTTAPAYVTIGTNGTIVTSRDLKTWAAQSSPISLRLFSVFWYHGQFLVLGDNGSILTSPDGLTWTTVPGRTSDTFHYGTILGNSLIMATKEGIDFSPDGVNWQLVAGTSNRMVDVATNGKLGVAVGSSPDNFRISTNGVVWSKANPSTAESLNAIVWTGNQFFAAGGNGTILTSPDGTSWTVRALGGNYTIEGVTGHENTFVAVTNAGLIFTNQKVATVARPEISFAPGPAGSTPQLEFKCANRDTKIFYTEDGSDPTLHSKSYTGPFSPAHSAIIKVRAYKDGLLPSAVATADFTTASATSGK